MICELRSSGFVLKELALSLLVEDATIAVHATNDSLLVQHVVLAAAYKKSTY